MKGLTPKQEAFCLAYAVSGNATEAYKKAYGASSDNAAAANSARLIRNDKIRRRLDELKNETNTPKVLSIQQRKEILSQFVTDDESSKMVKLKSIDLLNKMDSVYIQKQEISGAVPVVLADNVRE